MTKLKSMIIGTLIGLGTLGLFGTKKSLGQISKNNYEAIHETWKYSPPVGEKRSKNFSAKYLNHPNLDSIVTELIDHDNNLKIDHFIIKNHYNDSNGVGLKMEFRDRDDNRSFERYYMAIHRSDSQIKELIKYPASKFLELPKIYQGLPEGKYFSKAPLYTHKILGLNEKFKSGTLNILDINNDRVIDEYILRWFYKDMVIEQDIQDKDYDGYFENNFLTVYDEAFNEIQRNQIKDVSKALKSLKNHRKGEYLMSSKGLVFKKID